MRNNFSIVSRGWTRTACLPRTHPCSSAVCGSCYSAGRAFNKRFVISVMCHAKNRFAQFSHSRQSFYVMRKTASLNFRTPDSLFMSCEKPPRLIFALRTVFLCHAENRFAQFSHSGQSFLCHAENRFAQFSHSGQSFCVMRKTASLNFRTPDKLRRYNFC